MSIKEAYEKMQSECGIKVGDTVKILRAAESFEMGWDAGWNRLMTNTIGMEGVVIDIDGLYGIKIDIDHRSWSYPFFVLEKIKDKFPEVTMREVNEKFGYEVKIIEEKS
jgi:hypothetical protein